VSIHLNVSWRQIIFKLVWTFKLSDPIRFPAIGTPDPEKGHVGQRQAVFHYKLTQLLNVLVSCHVAANLDETIDVVGDSGWEPGQRAPQGPSARPFDRMMLLDLRVGTGKLPRTGPGQIFLDLVELEPFFSQ